MSYQVKVSPSALKDIKDIYLYIAEELMEPEYALKQYDRITHAILSLDEMPGRYPLVRFEPERTMGLHRMPVDNYSAFFMIKENVVTVTTVLYSASDIEHRLSSPSV